MIYFPGPFVQRGGARAPWAPLLATALCKCTRDFLLGVICTTIASGMLEIVLFCTTMNPFILYPMCDKKKFVGDMQFFIAIYSMSAL